MQFYITIFLSYKNVGQTDSETTEGEAEGLEVGSWYH